MKVVTIIGARPQFVKASVLSKALGKRTDMREVLVHTGQHFDSNMSDIFFNEMKIPKPDYHLGIGGGTHGQNTGRMIEAIETVLLQERPNLVLVYGDTDSTLAGALAAVKLHVPVAHVEAGLRSFNKSMPEEINRVLTDHTADLLFAPTENAVKNLSREGIPASKIYKVGDVMYDAAIHFAKMAEEGSSILEKLGLRKKNYVLATIHRGRNTDNPNHLSAIMDGLAASPLPVVLPLHPRTRKCIDGMNLKKSETIRLIDPVGYLDMTMLEKNARIIVTDSGGVQKEAFFYRVPCVTLRAETEWVELLELGWNRLAPPGSSSSIVAALSAALEEKEGRDGAPYGTGESAERICEILEGFSKGN